MANRTEEQKSQRKPIPGRVYLHYKGGLYEVLHLATSSVDESDQVVYKSLHYGSYHTRPLTEWFEVVKSKKRIWPFKDVEILRFDLYNG